MKDTSVAEFWTGGGAGAHCKGVSAQEGHEQDEQSQQQHQRDVLEARVEDRVEELKRVRAIFILASWSFNGKRPVVAKK